MPWHLDKESILFFALDNCLVFFFDEILFVIGAYVEAG